MELRTIGYFVAVADAGSVSAATRLTHITQPSLSRQLRQLEKELGLELFTRQDGRLTLTPAVFNDARHVLFLVSGASKAEAVAAALGDEDDPTRYPAQRVRPEEGEVVWFLDQEAAGLLEKN